MDLSFHKGKKKVKRERGKQETITTRTAELNMLRGEGSLYPTNGTKYGYFVTGMWFATTGVIKGSFLLQHLKCHVIKMTVKLQTQVPGQAE